MTTPDVDLESVAITEHALKRFRRRMRRPTATIIEVMNELRGGRFRADAPYAIDLSGSNIERNVGYVVTATAVFPIARSENGALCAPTVYRRQRRTKADRRAYREMMRGML